MAKLHKSKERRKRQYDRLIAAGFNSREANRYKDFSDDKIESLIEARIEATAKFKRIAGDTK